MDVTAIYEELASIQVNGLVKSGDIKKLAKQIGTDHDLALKLWSSGDFNARRVSVLILDKKLVTQSVIDHFVLDLEQLDKDQSNELADWLLANQLMKDKKTRGLVESWQKHKSPTLRRLFWYYQARLRWTGQEPPDNTESLLDFLESDIISEHSNVQWAMNFCAGQIGVHQPEHRSRCIKLGEYSGLFKDEIVARNCTPSYLPDFIRIEVAKREK